MVSSRMLKLEQESCASRFSHTINSSDNGGHDGEFSMKMEESIERTWTNFKTNLGARLLNALESLENVNVDLKFKL